MGIPAPSELILILLIVVVVFGPKKIPEIMGGIGKGIKTFKDSVNMDEKPAAPAAPCEPVSAKSASPSGTEPPRG